MQLLQYRWFNPRLCSWFKKTKKSQTFTEVHPLVKKWQKVHLFCKQRDSTLGRKNHVIQFLICQKKKKSALPFSLDNLRPNSPSSLTLGPPPSPPLRLRCHAKLQRQQPLQHHHQPVVHLQGHRRSGARVRRFPPGLHAQHLPQWVSSACAADSVAQQTHGRGNCCHPRSMCQPFQRKVFIRA